MEEEMISRTDIDLKKLKKIAKKMKVVIILKAQKKKSK